MKFTLLSAILFLAVLSLNAKNNKSIRSGIHWFDNNNEMVSAHGAGITMEGNKFYLFGEFKSDTSNAFKGVSCYSSENLVDWKFERVVLPVQKEGKLGPQRVGERPKVLKCPKTNEYVMYLHTDNMQYRDQAVGYATSKTINGLYTFRGSLLFNNEPIKKWDMGVFQDSNGKGYLITHSGNLYELSDDYKSVVRQVAKDMTRGCESPAIFKKDSLYYWIGSGLTGWERNDNYYFTAPSLEGPWTSRGIFAPKGSLTWNSQSTFVLPIAGSKDTTFIYMGDRWSHPKQFSAATYVWQPLEVNGHLISLPNFKQSWVIDTKTGEWTNTCIEGKTIDNRHPAIIYSGNWHHSSLEDEASDSRSDEKDATFSFTFTGTKVGLYSTARNDGGYAQVELKDMHGKKVVSTIIDMYCQYPETSLKFLSPTLPHASYTITAKVLGENWWWVEKSGRKSGSTGYFISLDRFVVE